MTNFSEKLLHLASTLKTYRKKEAFINASNPNSWYFEVPSTPEADALIEKEITRLTGQKQKSLASYNSFYKEIVLPSIRENIKKDIQKELLTKVPLSLPKKELLEMAASTKTAAHPKDIPSIALPSSSKRAQELEEEMKKAAQEKRDILKIFIIDPKKGEIIGIKEDALARDFSFEEVVEDLYKAGLINYCEEPDQYLYKDIPELKTELASWGRFRDARSYVRDSILAKGKIVPQQVLEDAKKRGLVPPSENAEKWAQTTLESDYIKKDGKWKLKGRFIKLFLSGILEELLKKSQPIDKDGNKVLFSEEAIKHLEYLIGKLRTKDPKDVDAAFFEDILAKFAGKKVTSPKVSETRTQEEKLQALVKAYADLSAEDAQLAGYVNSLISLVDARGSGLGDQTKAQTEEWGYKIKIDPLLSEFGGLEQDYLVHLKEKLENHIPREDKVNDINSAKLTLKGNELTIAPLPGLQNLKGPEGLRTKVLITDFIGSTKSKGEAVTEWAEGTVRGALKNAVKKAIEEAKKQKVELTKAVDAEI